MDANLRVVVSKDDSALKELLKSLADLQSLFGGAIPAAVKKASDTMKQSQASVVESVKQGSSAIVNAQTNANQKLQEVTERRTKFEKEAESLKFNALKEKYKELVTAHQNAQQAMREAVTKEQKAELALVEKTLKQEKQAYADTLRERKETKAGKASDVGMLGTKREVSGTGGGLMGLAGIGAAVELFKVGAEHAKEFSDAQASLHAATGLNIKDVEEWGAKYNKTGEEVGVVAAKVAAATGAQGPELKEQTEAVIAYASANRLSAEAVSKKMRTEAGRAAIFADAKRNEAIAIEKANDPAQKAEFVQKQLMSTIGQLAAVVMGALAPAIAAVQPILTSLGELIGSTVKPLMDKLQPIIAKVAELFTKLAPVITELVSGALEALAPILDVITENLGTLLDPIISIAKVIGETLSPIFKQLAPLIKALASIVLDQLTGNLQILLPVIGELLPPLIEALAPILQLLISIITPLAQLLAGALHGAIQLVTTALVWVVDKAIKPLVQWLGGELKKKVDDTVAFITKAVAAITKVVGEITSFLGLSDKAAAVATDATKKAGEAAQNEAGRQAEIAKLNEEKANKVALAAKLKSGKISAKELQALREQAEGEGDQIMLAKLDKFEEKKAKQGASAAKKGAKDILAAKRAAIDEELADEKDRIAALDITDREAKAQSRTAELKHQTDLRNIYVEGTKEYIRENRKLQALLIADAKQDRADKIADEKTKTDNLIAELSIRADREGLSTTQREKEQYQIEVNGLNAELALVQKGSEEEAKLLQQRNALIAKHNADARAQEIALNKEVEKNRLSNRRDEIANLKASGFDRRKIEEMETKLAIDEENERWKEEQATRKADMKANAALAEALETNHQNKLTAIDKQAAAQRQQVWMQNMQMLSGPVTKGIMAGITQITAGVHTMTANWQKSGGILGTIFGGILDGFVTMIEGMIEKIIAMEAILLVANLIPGFSAFMDMFQSFTSMIPGHAEGTDSSPGGWHFVGERGVELVNMRPGAQVIPNHMLNSALPMSTSGGMMDAGFGAHADRIIAAIQSSGQNVAHAAGRAKYGIPINDQWRSVVNNSAKAEDRRSF